MLTVDPKSTPPRDLHQFLLGAIAPRPIAFASTISEKGIPNIAPYSYFNAFNSNPPILAFSAHHKSQDKGKGPVYKDTMNNILFNKEVVINMVSHTMVRKMAVASVAFPEEINEFEKAGLTPIAADLIKPFRVKESPIHFECKVQQIVPLGDEGRTTGNLMICKVLRMHIQEDVLDDNKRINPHKIDLMGRMGRAYYVRASGEAIHTIVQPVQTISIGYDALPPAIKQSTVLTANNIGQLAGLAAIPDQNDILPLQKTPEIQEILQSKNPQEKLHRYIKKELTKDNLELAAQLAWLAEYVGF